MRRVVVFGGLGFIGSSIVDRYLDAGTHVVVVDSLVSSCVDAESYRSHADCEVHAVTAEDYCRDSMGSGQFDLAIHAASAVGPASILDRAGTLGATMIETTDCVIQACGRHDVPVVYFSSAEVYGRSGMLGESDTLQTPAGYNVRVEYALAKALGEAMLINSLTAGVRGIVIRPFNVVGPRQLRDGGFVFPTFARQVAMGAPLTVFHNGEESRAFTAVDDVARFVCDFAHAALQSDAHIFNVGNPANAATIAELAQLFLDVSGSSSKIQLCDPKEIYGDLYELAHSIVKLPVLGAATDIGWRPTTSLTELVEMCTQSVQLEHA